MEFGTRVVMERMIALIRNLAAPAMIVAAAALALAMSLSAQSEQTPVKEKTAAEVYKNIQVLKDIPASQLLPGMRYITTALSVKCNYCHVNPWQSDQKETKQTARRMMTMLFATNKDNFEGRTVVTCYTCHQGNHQPVAVPKLPEGAVPADFIRPNQPSAAPGQPAATTPTPAPAQLPTADTLLANFAQALGGDEALAKISSRVIYADLQQGSKSYPGEVDQKAPGKVYDSSSLPEGVTTGGFDGTRTWMQSGNEVRDADEIESLILRREAEINPIAALRAYKGRRVLGLAKIGDELTWVMRAMAPDGVAELLMFDAQSGLLVRRSIRQPTIFGSVPLEIDYADYRSVDGASLPFKTTWFTPGQSWSYIVKDVKDNVPVDDSKFAPPEKKP